MIALLTIIAAILFVRVAVDANRRRGYVAKFVVAFVVAWVVLFLMGI